MSRGSSSLITRTLFQLVKLVFLLCNNVVYACVNSYPTVLVTIQGINIGLNSGETKIDVIYSLL